MQNLQMTAYALNTSNASRKQSNPNAPAAAWPIRAVFHHVPRILANQATETTVLFLPLSGITK